MSNGTAYGLVVEDVFDGSELDTSLWVPHHLPQWSCRRQSAARYRIDDGQLRLRIEADQEPWCPEYGGSVRVSSIQTGVHAGALGTSVGQHRLDPAAVVREEQQSAALFTPHHGRIEMRPRMPDDPYVMSALWMIGLEHEPSQSAEICIAEVFGRTAGDGTALVGMGVHPFGDPHVVDDFAAVELPIDVREFHVYGAEWTADGIGFFVDGREVRTVPQSPAYPMQVMLGLYEFEDPDGTRAASHPQELVVDFFRAYRLADEGAAG